MLNDYKAVFVSLLKTWIEKLDQSGINSKQIVKDEMQEIIKALTGAKQN